MTLKLSSLDARLDGLKTETVTLGAWELARLLWGLRRLAAQLEAANCRASEDGGRVGKGALEVLRQGGVEP